MGKKVKNAVAIPYEKGYNPTVGFSGELMYQRSPIKISYQEEKEVWNNAVVSIAGVVVGVATIAVATTTTSSDNGQSKTTMEVASTTSLVVAQCVEDELEAIRQRLEKLSMEKEKTDKLLEEHDPLLKAKGDPTPTQTTSARKTTTGAQAKEATKIEGIQNLLRDLLWSSPCA
eukprot:Gb_13933 [translate_table: standard]